jgi:hypothetical protein
MRKTIVSAIAAVAAVAVGSVVVAGGFQFRANLSSAEEVPPPGVVIMSTAAGKVNVKVDSETRTATYNLRITEPITNVLQAHLHRGAAGTNGPIAVWLYPSAPPASLIPGVTEGALAHGEFGPQNLCYSPTAPYCVAGVGNWDAFVTDLENGMVYANVHTVAYPGGEIRGQVHHNTDND